jgi:hypothetical protein
MDPSPIADSAAFAHRAGRQQANDTRTNEDWAHNHSSRRFGVTAAKAQP